MNDSNNPAGHYAAFETSAALRRVGEQLVWEVENGNWRQHEALIAVIEHFDRESAKAYVMDGIHAMGITGSAEHFVQSTLNTLSLTITKLSKQIVPKLDKQQMTLAASHVRSLSITIAREDGSLCPMTGFRVPDAVNARREQIVARIRDGHWQSERKAVSELLSDLGDLMLEEIYLKSIRLMGFGFLTEKLIQGGAAIGRGLQHQLINWAVSTLGESEFRTLADYTEKVHLHLPSPTPHT
ncbi:MAG: hypothetical protein ACK4UT_08030, partial [Moraxellaceae bacterium]